MLRYLMIVSFIGCVSSCLCQTNIVCGKRAVLVGIEVDNVALPVTSDFELILMFQDDTLVLVPDSGLLYLPDFEFSDTERFDAVCHAGELELTFTAQRTEQLCWYQGQEVHWILGRTEVPPFHIALLKQCDELKAVQFWEFRPQQHGENFASMIPICR